MSFVRRTIIEKVWIVASVSIFAAHRLLVIFSPDYYAAVRPFKLWLEAAMIALSFPLGIMTLFTIHDAQFWCDGCRELHWMLNWATLLFAGYVQWFWLLPEFLRDRKLTLLDLKRPPETVAPNAAPAIEDATPAAAPFHAASPAAFEAAPLPAFDAAMFSPCLAEFDEAGLTALDRVFQAQPPTAAPAPPSHVEAIFPRVS